MLQKYRIANELLRYQLKEFSRIIDESLKLEIRGEGY